MEKKTLNVFITPISCFFFSFPVTCITFVSAQSLVSKQMLVFSSVIALTSKFPISCLSGS